ncbi:MAG: ribosome biogenesis GTP-binding protein YsxC [Fibrobacteria bacterium]|nr:ribosome biogenesis GTP-binding protein YsxC [Fibrobacteria bacterium]
MKPRDPVEATFLWLGQKARFVKGAVAPDGFVDDALPQVAFAGRSNVGKSSLQNALLGRSGLVRTSRTPGRTREINFFEVPESFWFVDLPGFGYARGGVKSSEAFAKLVGDYLSHDRHPALLLYVLDAEVIDSEVDEICLGRIMEAGVRVQVLLNKADRLDQSARNRHPRLVQERYGLEAPPWQISARTGSGLGRVRSAILELLPSAPG